MSGKVPLAVTRARWLRTNDRMTVERAQECFLAMYEDARGGPFNDRKRAPTAALLKREVDQALSPGWRGTWRQRAVLFAQALQKARGKIQP